MLHKVGERVVELFLELGICYYEVRLIVPARQADAFINPGIQLVQAGQHVANVEDRPPVLVDAVEDIIPE